MTLAAIGLFKQLGSRVHLDKSETRVTGIVSFETGYDNIDSVQQPRRHLSPRLSWLYQQSLLFLPPSIDAYDPNVELVLRDPLWVAVPFPPPFFFRKRVFELALQDPAAFERDLKPRLERR